MVDQQRINYDYNDVIAIINPCKWENIPIIFQPLITIIQRCFLGCAGLCYNGVLLKL